MSIPNHTKGKVCRSNGSTVQIDQLMKMKRKNFSINFYSIYWLGLLFTVFFFHIYRVIKFVFGCKIFKKGVKTHIQCPIRIYLLLDIVHFQFGRKTFQSRLFSLFVWLFELGSKVQVTCTKTNYTNGFRLSFLHHTST